MTHAYPTFARSPALTDAFLAACLPLVALVTRSTGLRATLLVAISVALAWSFATLHYPTRIDLDDAGISFQRYGRVHRFLWRDVTRLRVRRFVVRDRVLVRVGPAGPWRGRYWVDERIEGFDALVAALERRAGS